VSSTYFWLFLVGGVSLVALVWLGAGDDGGGHHTGDAGPHGLLQDTAALLTARGVLAAMTAAGATGLLLGGVLQLPSALALAGACAGGVVGAMLWRRAMRLMVAFDRNHAVSPDVLVGREGTLTVGIAGSEAPGVLQVVLGGVSQEYTAVASDGRAYTEGERVLVVRLRPDQVVVVESSPYPALSSSP
jgi:membrane protein implicated in regulation of membrane protease activity